MQWLTNLFVPSQTDSCAEVGRVIPNAPHVSAD
jgi:hypothetical protein